MGSDRVRGVVETCLYVEDVEEAAAWYKETLGFSLYSLEQPRHAFFTVGDSMLLLFNPDETRTGRGDGPPGHGARGAQHVAFAVDALDRWRERLEDAGVAVTHEQDWGEGSSLYFEDPFGNVLELVEPGTWPVW